MSLKDTAGNLITLGVAYKMTDKLMSKTTKRKTKKKKRR